MISAVGYNCTPAFAEWPTQGDCMPDIYWRAGRRLALLDAAIKCSNSPTAALASFQGSAHRIIYFY